jgi:hypothetical protein
VNVRSDAARSGTFCSRSILPTAFLPDADPHLFTHTLATDLLSKGVSLQTVSTLLGQSFTKMAERRYSHWIRGRLEKLEDELKKSGVVFGRGACNPTKNINFKGKIKKGGGPGLPASPYSPFGESG